MVGRNWHCSSIGKFFPDLLALFQKNNTILMSNSYAAHQEDDQNFNNDENGAEHRAAAHGHNQSHGAKAGGNEIDHENDMLALERNVGHQVMQMVPIGLEHTRKTPDVRTLRFFYKTYSHHEQRIDDWKTQSKNRHEDGHRSCAFDRPMQAHHSQQETQSE